MLTKNTLVKYNHEALCLSGNWVTTMDGGRLLKCKHDRAIKWYDAYVKRHSNGNFRFRFPSFKQLTLKELEYTENQIRNSLTNCLMRTAYKISLKDR